MAKITIDDLASMMQKEFTSLHQEIADFKIENKKDHEAIRTELKDAIKSTKTELKEEIAMTRIELRNEISSKTGRIRDDISKLEIELNDIKERLDRIEQRTLDDDQAIVEEVYDLRTMF